MYRVLRAEMVRAGISVKGLALQIGITEGSLRNKIIGKTDFFWSVVLKIRNAVAPNMPLEELFQRETKAA